MTNYQKAALAYLAYACVYITAAALRMTPERMSDFNGVPWYWFFIGGAALLVIIPTLIWRKGKWITRIFAFGPTGKSLVLFYREGKSLMAGEAADPYNLFFGLIAAGAAILMFRAGFGNTDQK